MFGHPARIIAWPGLGPLSKCAAWGGPDLLERQSDLFQCVLQVVDGKGLFDGSGIRVSDIHVFGNLIFPGFFLYREEPSGPLDPLLIAAGPPG